MRQPNDSFKLAKQETDLNIISNSLNDACCIKYKDNSLIVEKKILIFKIVDFCHVTPTKAKEYLDILESRGIVEIDRNAVYYKNQENIKLSKEIKEEADKYFQKFKNGNI